MLRIWGKIWKDNHMIQDVVVRCDDESLNRTRQIYYCLDEICYEFDLSKPIWLEQSKKEFILHDKVRFTQDNFIDSIDFDYLEFHIIEEQ